MASTALAWARDHSCASKFLMHKAENECYSRTVCCLHDRNEDFGVEQKKNMQQAKGWAEEDVKLSKSLMLFAMQFVKM